MRRRSLISATYDGDIPERHKIPAADGVMGTIVLLAYWGGGKNLFPDGVLPEFFVDGKQDRGTVKIDIEGLTDLIGELSKAMNREIGQLSVGSLPAYLTNMRRGERANGNGQMVPVETSYSRRHQILYIFPRKFEEDKVAGLTELIPEGLI